MQNTPLRVGIIGYDGVNAIDLAFIIRQLF